jgi:nucleoside-diphosphate-sugar epimerase
VCRANLIAAEKGRGYRVYNVGGGIGLWMYDIAEKINCAFGGNCKIKDMGERFGDVPIAVANITRIKEELGWKPEVFFDEGLRITLDHYK